MMSYSSYFPGDSYGLKNALFYTTLKFLSSQMVDSPDPFIREYGTTCSNAAPLFAPLIIGFKMHQKILRKFTRKSCEITYKNLLGGVLTGINDMEGIYKSMWFSSSPLRLLPSHRLCP